MVGEVAGENQSVMTSCNRDFKDAECVKPATADVKNEQLEVLQSFETL